MAAAAQVAIAMTDRPLSPAVPAPVLPVVLHDEIDTIAPSSSSYYSTTCRWCLAVASIRTEWAQGDRVCTSCGVVHAQHIMDTGPEWRDYGDNDDSGGAAAAAGRARSGMVATDESKYVGGLQPTTVSKYVFGQSGTSSSVASYGATRPGVGCSIAHRLQRANRKIDKCMEQRHKKAFTNAALRLKLLRKRQQEVMEHRQQQQQQSDVATTTTVDTDADTVNTNTDTAVTNDDADTNIDSFVDDVQPDYGSGVIWMEERPELEQQILEQQELVEQQRRALHAEKWSLDRAKTQYRDSAAASTMMDASSKKMTKADEALQAAARDVYTCHELLVQAATTLQLPTAIVDEAATLLCQYAARRDGLKVRGVATTTRLVAATMNTGSAAVTLGQRQSKQLFSRPPNGFSFERQRLGVRSKSSSPLHTTHHGTKNDNSEQEQLLIREANKHRQMGALCAALLFWTARHRQRPRSLVAVCDSIVLPTVMKTATSTVPIRETVKRNHCRCAMDDLREYFPEVVATMATTSPALLTHATVRGQEQPQQQHQSSHSMTVPQAISVQSSSSPSANDDANVVPESSSQNSTATRSNNAAASSSSSLSLTEAASVADFVEHALRKLTLPPVAEACIRYLVFLHLENNDVEQMTAPSNNSNTTTALKTICAAVTYFVCRAGAVMQQLAAQAQSATSAMTATQTVTANAIRKRQAASTTERSRNEKKAKLDANDETNVMDGAVLDLFDESLATDSSSTKATTAQDEAKSSSSFLAEQRAYEMRRMWDAWSEQLPWSRTLPLVEQSTNVSRHVIWDYFKQRLFPHRQLLLSALSEASSGSRSSNTDTSSECEQAKSALLQTEMNILTGTPLASVLLPHMTVAVMLMKTDKKI